MIERIGHWLNDRAADRLVRDDGASLCRLGTAEDMPTDGSGEWSWFELHSGGQKLRLLVERHERCFGADYAANQLQFIPSWRVDFVRSFALAGFLPSCLADWWRWRSLAEDGFACWGLATADGPVTVATRIGIAGDWSEGGWRNDRYSIARGMRTSHLEPKLEAIPDPGREQIWTFCAKGRTSVYREVFERIAGSCEPALGKALSDRLIDGPCLISQDRAIVPTFVNQGWLHLLYVDEEIVTDRIALHASATEQVGTWHLSDVVRVMLGTHDRCMRRVDFMHDFDKPPRANFDAEKCTEGRYLPARFAARIKLSLQEGLFHWRDGEIDVATPGAGLQLRTLFRPEALSIEGVSLTAGQVDHRSTIVRRDLDDGEFAAFFDPGRCQATCSTAMPLAVGKLRISPDEGLATVVAESWQLRSISPAKDSALPVQVSHWQVANEHGEGIIVVRHVEGRLTEPTTKTVIDLNASFDLWTNEERSSLSDSGWFAAMQQFAAEALLAWPTHSSLGSHPRTIEVVGGMMNDRWERSLRRRIEPPKSAFGIQSAGRGPVQERELPATWIRMPGESPAGSPPPVGRGPATACDSRDQWSASRPDHAAKWRSDDRGILVPVGAERTGGHNARSITWFDYRDEDVSIRLERSDGIFHLQSIWRAMAPDGPLPPLHLVRVWRGSDGNLCYEILNPLFERIRAALESDLIPGEIVGYVDRLRLIVNARATTHRWLEDQDYARPAWGF